MPPASPAAAALNPEHFVIAFVGFLVLYLHLSPLLFRPAILAIIDADHCVTRSWLCLAMSAVSCVGFHAACAAVYVFYFMACTTAPGRIPAHRSPPAIELSHASHCRYCDRVKPPRTHHCTSCNACVLRMDHHCPWIGGCVGMHNHAHFIRFLYAVVLATSLALIRITYRIYAVSSVWDTYEYYRNPITAGDLVVLGTNLLGNLLVLILVGVLAVFQTLGLIGGYTSVEAAQMEKLERLVSEGRVDKAAAQFPYDLGRRGNIEQVMGVCSIRALLDPRCVAFEDGTAFKVNRAWEESNGDAQWPPREYEEEHRVWRRGRWRDPKVPRKRRAAKDANGSDDVPLVEEYASEEGFGWRHRYELDDSGEYVIPAPVYSLEDDKGNDAVGTVNGYAMDELLETMTDDDEPVSKRLARRQARAILVSTTRR